MLHPWQQQSIAAETNCEARRQAHGANMQTEAATRLTRQLCSGLVLH